MLEVTGKIAVITGAGSGIGRGLAQVFAQAGIKLVLADIEYASAEETRRLLGLPARDVLVQKVDVASRDDVDALADTAYRHFGSVDILCNNAGVVPWQRAEDADHRAWEWVISINLWGVIHGIEAFLPRMRAQGTPGHIVNTASIAGLVPSRISALYSTSKFAVVGLSETLHEELKDTGIGVSVLCPAVVATRIRETSNRNRPAGMPAKPDVVQRSGLGAGAPAVSPVECATMVLDAIRNNRLHIVTEPTLRPILEQRFRKLLEAFDALDKGRS